MSENNSFKSDYFQLKVFDFKREDVEKAIEDLDRFKRIFQEALARR